MEIEMNSWEASMNEDKEKKMGEFREKLKDSLQNSKSNLAAGGAGFADLLRELLIANGYAIRETPNWPKRDAALVAERRSPFGNMEKLVVKIRTDKGRRDDDYVSSLINARDSDPALAGHKGIFITTTDHILPDAQALAQDNNMETWTISRLVDLIVESLDKLAPSMKEKLGIYSVPVVFFY